MSEHLTIAELLELAHKHRALHIKAGPLEVTLHPSAFELTTSPDSSPGEQMPTEEDFLFMAGLQLEKSE